MKFYRDLYEFIAHFNSIEFQRNLRIRQLCRLTNYEDYKRLSYKNNISVKDYKRKIANY